MAFMITVLFINFFIFLYYFNVINLKKIALFLSMGVSQKPIMAVIGKWSVVFFVRKIVQNAQFVSSIGKLGTRMPFFNFDSLKFINYYIEEEYPFVDVNGEEGLQPQRQTHT